MADVPLLPAEVRADLERRYAEPHRRFHTLLHVSRVLADVERLLDALPREERARVDGNAVRLAAWFHDAVYDPRSSTNEADSADLAARALIDTPHLAGHLPAVRRLILATAEHRPARGAVDEAVLLDADMAILAVNPAEYEAYAAAVRAEYAHLDNDAWQQGRAAFLQRALDRPRLFNFAEASVERAARANLARELARLTGGAAAPGPTSGTA